MSLRKGRDTDSVAVNLGGAQTYDRYGVEWNRSNEVFIGLTLAERLFLVSLLRARRKEVAASGGARWEPEMCDRLVDKLVAGA